MNDESVSAARKAAEEIDRLACPTIEAMERIIAVACQTVAPPLDFKEVRKQAEEMFNRMFKGLDYSHVGRKELALDFAANFLITHSGTAPVSTPRCPVCAGEVTWRIGDRRAYCQNQMHMFDMSSEQDWRQFFQPAPEPWISVKERLSTEEIYDKEIAPLMAQIIATCKTHKIPVVSVFELADKEGEPVSCQTSLNTESAAMRMLHYMAQSGNNFDLFVIKCRRDAELMKNNTSAIMHLLDHKPVAEPAPPEEGK